MYEPVNSEMQEKIVELICLVTDLAAKLNALGVRSLPITPTSNQLYRSPEYTRTLRHYFSHKMVGTRAGLGWIGKSDLFILSLIHI